MYYVNPNTGEGFQVTGNREVNLGNSLRSQEQSTQDFVWDCVRKLETHVPRYMQDDNKKVEA